MSVISESLLSIKELRTYGDVQAGDLLSFNLPFSLTYKIGKVISKDANSFFYKDSNGKDYGTVQGKSLESTILLRVTADKKVQILAGKSVINILDDLYSSKNFD